MWSVHIFILVCLRFWLCSFQCVLVCVCIRRAWRYQRGNQNPYIEEEQTTQWPKQMYKRKNNNLQNIHIRLTIEEHEHGKSWIRKVPRSVYDKWNISVVICDTDIQMYNCYELVELALFLHNNLLWRWKFYLIVDWLFSLLLIQTLFCDLLCPY